MTRTVTTSLASAVLFACARQTGPAGGDTAPAADSALADAAIVPGDLGPDAPDDGGDLDWSPLGESNACELFFARGVDKLPIRTWDECGAGCGAAKVGRTGYASGFIFATAASAVGSETYVRLYMGPATGWFGAAEIVRASDWKTIAFVAQRSSSYPCGVTNWSSTALVLPLHKKGAYTAVSFGKAPGEAPLVGIDQADVAITKSAFSAGGGFGATFDDGRVRFTASLTVPWSVIDEVSNVDRTVSRGDAAFWIASAGPNEGSVRGFTVGGTAKEFVVVRDRAASLGASDDKLAWVAVHGSRAWLGEYDSAEVAWSPLPKTPTDVAVAGSIPL